jgi:hypothetical protein
MNRRGFISSLVGGVAATAAVRSWPFRVFSFPAQVITPGMRDHGEQLIRFALEGDHQLDALRQAYEYDKPMLHNLKSRNWMTVTKVDYRHGVITLRPTHELYPKSELFDSLYNGKLGYRT